jgi:hypothetical protein
LQLMRAAAGGFGDDDGDRDGRAISTARAVNIEATTITASLPEEDRTKCGPSAKGEKNLWTEATYARVEQILYEVRLFLCLHGILSLNLHLWSSIVW